MTTTNSTHTKAHGWIHSAQINLRRAVEQLHHANDHTPPPYASEIRQAVKDCQRVDAQLADIRQGLRQQ